MKRVEDYTVFRGSAGGGRAAGETAEIISLFREAFNNDYYYQDDDDDDHDEEEEEEGTRRRRRR